MSDTPASAAPGDPPAPAPTPVPLARPPRRVVPRPWPLRLLVLAAKLLVALIVLTTLLRLTLLTDARLARLVEAQLGQRLGVPVTLGALSFELLFGLELSDLRVPPPPGYQHDVLRVGRIALRWAPWRLLRGELVLEELAVERLAATAESRDGTSFAHQLLLARLRGPAAPPAPAPESPPQERAPFVLPRLPHLPVVLRLERLSLDQWHLALRSPARDLVLAPLSITLQAGFADAQPDAVLDVLVGQTAEQPARLTIVSRQPELDADVALWIALRTRTSSLARHDLSLELHAAPRLRRPYPLRTPPVTLGAHLSVDLAEQRVALDHLALLLGDRELLALAVSVAQVLRQPALTLDVARVSLPLGDLANLARPVLPGLSASGHLGLHVAPLRLPGDRTALLRELSLAARLRASDLRLRLPAAGLALDDLDGGLELRLDAEALELRGILTLAQASSGQRTLRGLTAKLDSRLPLPPLLAYGAPLLAEQGFDPAALQQAGAGEGERWHTTATLGLAEARQAETLARGLRLGLELGVPVAAWLRGGEPGDLGLGVSLRLAEAGATNADARTLGARLTLSLPDSFAARLPQLARLPATMPPPPGLVQAAARPARPATARLALGLAGAGQAGRRVERLSLDARVAAHDAAGARAAVNLRLDVPRVRIDDPRLGLLTTSVQVALDAERLGPEAARVERLRLQVGELLSLAATAAVEALRSPAPRLALDLQLGPWDLARLWHVLPPGLTRGKEGWALSGSLAAGLRAAGLLPLDTLRQLAAQAAQRDGGLPRLAPAFAFVQRGLPLHAELTVDWDGVTMRQPGLSLSGAKGGLRLESGPDQRRPALGLRLTAERIVQGLSPGAVTTLDGLSLTVDTALEGAQLPLGVRVGLARLERPSQLAQALGPLNLGCDARLIYAGDLSLRCALALPVQGLGAEAALAVVKPHLVAQTRAWTSPGLPGLDVAGRLGVWLDQAAPLTLSATAPTVSGSLALRSDFALRDGGLDLGLVIDADDFSLRRERLALRSLAGHLPVRLALAFSPRPQHLVLARGLPLGGGVLALRVSGDDILRNPPRPAYYDQLRPYRAKAGISLLELRAGPLALDDLAIDLSLAEGILTADYLRLRAVGGDFAGDLALQLSADGVARLSAALVFAGVDASVLTDVPPGPASELNGDLRLSLEQAELARNLNAEMNLSKIGAATFDRLLQALDPAGQSPSLQNARSKLWMIDLQRLALSIKYENLKMYLQYKTFLGIPGTPLALKPIPQEFPRIAISERLDKALGPLVANQLGPLLGWTSTRRP